MQGDVAKPKPVTPLQRVQHTTQSQQQSTGRKKEEALSVGAFSPPIIHQNPLHRD